MPQWTGCVRKTLLCTALLALLPGAALAQNKDRSIELGVSVTFIRFDSQSEMDQVFAPTLLVGYNFSKRHGGEIAFTSATPTPDTGDSMDIDVDIWRLGYTYNAYPREKMVSFFRLGVGGWNIDPDPTPDAPERLSESDSQPMIYAGGGIRYFLKPWLGVRIAGTIDFIDAGDGFPNADVQATADVGLTFLLGGVESVEPPAETPPAEEEPAPQGTP